MVQRTPVRRVWAGSDLILAVLLAVVAAPHIASGQPFSPNDGYAADGSPRLHVELTPYLWLPATESSFSLGPRGDITGSRSTGVPSLGHLANTLHMSFMGEGIVRYGPWSAELNLDWVTASSGKTKQLDRLGAEVHGSGALDVIRISPGVGYQVYRGTVFDVPMSADVRTGFTFFHWSAKIGTVNFPDGISGDNGFVQPWLGGRVDFYPSPKWRVELGAAAQGFGIDGGSWGWTASALLSYLITDWFDITGGFSALRTARYGDNRFSGAQTRSIDVTLYGPLIGVGFRF